MKEVSEAERRADYELRRERDLRAKRLMEKVMDHVSVMQRATADTMEHVARLRDAKTIIHESYWKGRKEGIEDVQSMLQRAIRKVFIGDDDGDEL